MAFKAFNNFLDAVNKTPELAIDMPSTPEQWDEIFQQFKQRSINQIMAGCFGCVGGFFQGTNKPSKKLPMCYCITLVTTNHID